MVIYNDYIFKTNSLCSFEDNYVHDEHGSEEFENFVM